MFSALPLAVARIASARRMFGEHLANTSMGSLGTARNVARRRIQCSRAMSAVCAEGYPRLPALFGPTASISSPPVILEVEASPFFERAGILSLDAHFDESRADEGFK